MSRFRPKIIVWLNKKGKWKLGLLGLAFVVGMTLVSLRIPASSKWTSWSMPLSGMIIAIDAGHGGVDGGAISKSGAIEKDLNLSIALDLRDYLQEAGAIVVMTREGDYDLAAEDTKTYSKRKTEDLLSRVAKLQDSKAQLVVSIHMNSVPSDRWSGAQTFYDENAPEQSILLAQSIQAQMKQNLGNTNREANKVSGIYLIKSMSPIPTALVEVGFLSNAAESKRLVDAEYQRIVAASIYKGILDFLVKQENK